MRKVRLGKTDLMVSEVGFGGIPITRLSEDEAIRVVRRSIELGVTLIDTAHNYGTSEERIGRAIAGRREGLILATKSWARDSQTFRQELETSFERLGVEHIDLFQFHNVTSKEAYQQILYPGGPLDIAREAKAANRIGHIGVSSHSLELSLEMVESGNFETLMFPFNFVTDEAVEKLLPACRENDVGFIAMKPLGGGILENATLDFKYLQQFPDVVPIPGIETIGEIEEIVSIMEGPEELTAEERAEMERIRRDVGTRFCRRCGYCQPCPQGINISLMMHLRSFAKRLPEERVFGEWGGTIVASVEKCADCGECEAKCPYALPIREVIAENVVWYEQEMAKRGLNGGRQG